jgi:hypothetical protein
VSHAPGGLTLSRLGPDEAERHLGEVVFRLSESAVVGDWLAAQAGSWSG